MSAVGLLESGTSSLFGRTADVEYSQMTREQLLRARAEIYANRPSWTPNVLLLIFTPTLGAGATVTLALLGGPIGLAIGIVLVVAMIATGIVLHATRAGDRARANVELEVIDGLLESGGPLPAQPPSPGPPVPPPPPYPASRSVFTPLTIASF